MPKKRQKSKAEKYGGAGCRESGVDMLGRQQGCIRVLEVQRLVSANNPTSSSHADSRLLQL